MQQYLKSARRKAFGPMVLFSVGIVLNLVMCLAIAYLVWNNQQLAGEMSESFRLQRLAGNVAYLHEGLTMAARIACATGDPAWENRYRQFEAELDSTVTEIALSARHEYRQNYMAKSKLAYLKLIEMEQVALSLVRRGRHEEAHDLIFSPEYERRSAEYSEGLKQLTEAVEQRIDEKVSSFGARIRHLGALSVVSLFILLFAWIGVSVVLRVHLEKRRRAESDLEDEKEFLSVTLRSIGDGVISANTEGRIAIMNREAEELTGWTQEAALGRHLEEIYITKGQQSGQAHNHPASIVLQTGRVCSPDRFSVLTARDGSERVVSESAAPICDRDSNVEGVVLIFRDVTEEQRIQNELIKREKLESVGILAGGIAHDFNNLLTGILGNISVANVESERTGRNAARLAEAEKACVRAKDLTQQLMAFARGGAPVKKTATIHELLEDWTRFALRGSNVRCELDVSEELWPADIDEGQIGQVINNLVINADQAMPDGGTVIVGADNCVIGFEKTEGHVPLKPGRYVRIWVQDSGTGIPPENLSKVFDPYFTTKPDGNGLGLATSFAVIKRHEGHIEVTSEMGIGSTFRLYVPASEKDVVQRSKPLDTAVNGKGRVLVMDDDPTIRELAGDLLSVLGYRVSLAEDGTEALKLYKESVTTGIPFDAVIMDLTIPGGMGGKEAIQKLREVNPQIRAIVSSGYSNDPVMADFRSYGFHGVLTKPYTAHQMSSVLHTVIYGTDTNGADPCSPQSCPCEAT